MITLNNSQKLFELSSPIHSPFEFDETLFLTTQNGDILKFSEGQLRTQFKCNGQPSSIVFDSQKNTYYLGDLANQAILAYTIGDAQPTELVKEYEGVPLLGPYALILSKKTGNIIFTDSGPFSETSFQNPKGSIFMIDMQQQNIKSLALRCLVQPTGISFDHDEKLFYVCQTGKNRLIRFYQSPEGIFYSNIFYQFSGRFGPTAVTVTSTNLVITALFQFKNIASEGLVSILNNSGQQLAKLKLNHTGPQITGLFFSHQITMQQFMPPKIAENRVAFDCLQKFLKRRKSKNRALTNKFQNDLIQFKQLYVIMKTHKQEKRISKDQLMKIQNTLKNALVRCQKLIEMKRNIKLSKPILQAIQNKIKKRQNILQRKIEQEIQVNTQSIKKIQEFKKLHELGVNILQKNGLLSNFEGLDNYASKSMKIQTEKLNSVRQDIRSYMNASDTHYITNQEMTRKTDQIIVNQSNENKPPSAYQILQSKLKQNKNEKTSQECDLKKHIQKISQRMKHNSQKLRQMKTIINNQYQTKRTIQKSKQKQLSSQIQSQFIDKKKLNEFMANKNRRISQFRNNMSGSSTIFNIRQL